MRRIAKTPPSLILGDFTRNAIINSPSLDDLVQTTHWARSRRGARLGINLWSSSGAGTSITSATLADVDGATGLLRPQRATQDAKATATASTSTHLVQVEALGDDIAVQVDFYDTDNLDGASVGSITVDLDGASGEYGTASAFIDLPDSSALLAKVQARYGTSSPGTLYEVNVHEAVLQTPYTHQDTLLAYGNEWVGYFDTLDSVDTWDSDGYGGFSAPTSGRRPTMVRDGVATGVHSLSFDDTAPDRLDSAGLDLTDLDSILFGCLFKQSGGTWDDVLVSVHKGSGAVSDYTAFLYLSAAGSVQLAVYNDASGSSTYTGSVANDTSWHSVVGFWRTGSGPILFIDGVKSGAGSALSGDLNNTTAYAFAGGRWDTSFPFNGEIALPFVMCGGAAYSEKDALALAQWHVQLAGI